jgi:F-type H+-transporting ATPase subunit b
MLHDPEFWIAVGLVILVAAIFRPVKSALLGGLDARGARIGLELEVARKLREEAAALVETYRKKQGEALAESEAVIRNAAAEAERSREQAAAALEESLKRQERQALDRIAQAEVKALAEVRALAVDLAVAATRRLLTDHLDAARGAALVDLAIAELPQRLQ